MPQVSRGWDSRPPLEHGAPVAIWPIQQGSSPLQKREATPPSLIRPHRLWHTIVAQPSGGLNERPSSWRTAPHGGGEESMTTIQRILC